MDNQRSICETVHYCVYTSCCNNNIHKEDLNDEIVGYRLAYIYRLAQPYVHVCMFISASDDRAAN
jgi:hypothetical protein